MIGCGIPSWHEIINEASTNVADAEGLVKVHRRTLSAPLLCAVGNSHLKHPSCRQHARLMFDSAQGRGLNHRSRHSIHLHVCKEQDRDDRLHCRSQWRTDAWWGPGSYPVYCRLHSQSSNPCTTRACIAGEPLTVCKKPEMFFRLRESEDVAMYWL